MALWRRVTRRSFKIKKSEVRAKERGENGPTARGQDEWLAGGCSMETGDCAPERRAANNNSSAGAGRRRRPDLILILQSSGAAAAAEAPLESISLDGLVVGSYLLRSQAAAAAAAHLTSRLAAIWLLAAARLRVGRKCRRSRDLLCDRGAPRGAGRVRPYGEQASGLAGAARARDKCAQGKHTARSLEARHSCSERAGGARNFFISIGRYK